MARRLDVSVISFTIAPAPEQARGLLGWLALDVDGLLLLDGVALRRTKSGRLGLSFPERPDSQGRRRPLIRPLDDASRREVERQVFEALGVEAE